MIGIIDYGAGNLHSVDKAVRKLGFQTKLLTNPEDFTGINKIIFPGVGNAKKTMEIIRASKIDTKIIQSIAAGTPFLGICLGMQLLLEFSEENNADCLSIFEGKVLPFKRDVKVPHMGWNEVQQQINHPIFKSIPDKADFYFVHSFYVNPSNNKDAIGTTDYGQEFCSVIAKDNVVGVQFHPEKSADAGLTLLQNFCGNSF
ncbi:MAG TPA: imidazole glycerol phosphate synthase subunit HisH [Bacillaceae bacterium]|nr:imidazole glycerol phosphate synthase subunit HisH [Paenibacillus bovis]HLU21230.1 imidazole glycerol phosphate synthase subunit HisH [Bacillaceae bacterium]